MSLIPGTIARILWLPGSDRYPQLLECRINLWGLCLRRGPVYSATGSIRTDAGTMVGSKKYMRHAGRDKCGHVRWVLTDSELRYLVAVGAFTNDEGFCKASQIKLAAMLGVGRRLKTDGRASAPNCRGEGVTASDIILRVVAVGDDGCSLRSPPYDTRRALSSGASLRPAILDSPAFMRHGILYRRRHHEPNTRVPPTLETEGRPSTGRPLDSDLGPTSYVRDVMGHAALHDGEIGPSLLPCAG